MPVTGLYFIPATQNSPTVTGKVVERLRSAYNPTLSGHWALEHRLLRDTPSCLPPSAYAPLPPLQPRFMQFLSFSHRHPHSFIYMSDRPSPDPWDPGQAHNATPQQQQQQQQHQQHQQHQHQHHHHHHQPAIPPQQQQQQPTQQPKPTDPPPQKAMMILDIPSYRSLYTITVQACEPLWCHRHTVIVQTGLVFEVSDFRIRIGEVRQSQPVTRLRGTIVEIEYRGPATVHSNNNSITTGEQTATSGMGIDIDADDGIIYPDLETASDIEEIPTDEDWEVGEELIRELWGRFSVEGAREVIRGGVPHLGKEAREARAAGRLGDKEVNGRIAGVDLARQYMEVFRFNR
ncbi:hypothetical protein FQN50_000674 [Emmonsiellopsis sp. PD_5]|nr:hypothetical protein FQN50_000674 [Emmonsiellopsis sp. PD_5]